MTAMNKEYNHMNTDWSVMDELILQSPKDLQPEDKPKRKDYKYKGDECDLFFYYDMMYWYIYYNNNIDTFRNNLSIFFGIEFSEHKKEYFTFYRKEYDLLNKQYTNNKNNMIKYENLHMYEGRKFY